MARQRWEDLTDRQRDDLARSGISRSEWNAGTSPIDPPSEPPREPPDNAGRSPDGFPDPDELEDAVNDPDGHADFWFARGGGRVSRSDHRQLEDSALRRIEREVGDAAKFNHHAIAERLESLNAKKLNILAAMNESQFRRMAQWANDVYRRTGSRSFVWLFYH